LINSLKNFPQTSNRSLLLIFRKILLILAKDFLEMIRKRRENMAKAKAEIEKIEDKIIQEMMEEEEKWRARRRKEVFNKILKQI